MPPTIVKHRIKTVSPSGTWNVVGQRSGGVSWGGSSGVTWAASPRLAEAQQGGHSPGSRSSITRGPRRAALANAEPDWRKVSSVLAAGLGGRAGAGLPGPLLPAVRQAGLRLPATAATASAS